ncbi:hypothetical protein AAHA92_30760 [Salvia divinorum]|uniref:Uncharacterized protein n=1 Tax=Salvia divinorum TaxID=28513 RepID=A0ABD1FRX0_SALDI
MWFEFLSKCGRHQFLWCRSSAAHSPSAAPLALPRHRIPLNSPKNPPLIPNRNYSLQNLRQTLNFFTSAASSSSLRSGVPASS